MSLQDAAKHLSMHGRGPDDHLVHMSGKEVQSLQKLAQAHGGSLTTNPHTGLPEAGFLDSMLPTIIGAGIAAFAPETLALDPALIGAGVGALQYARTGDLSKGLMAGLGAYGGAGMAGSLMSSGASQVGANAVGPEAQADLQKQIADAAAQNPEVTAEDQANAYNTGLQNKASSAITSATPMDKLQAGVNGLTPSNALSSLGGWKTIGAAAAPGVMGLMQGQTAPTTPNSATITPYTYARNPVYTSSTQTPPGAKPLIGATYQPGQDTSERTYFNPVYTAQTPYTYTMAEGGMAPPQQQMAANAVGGNNMYPQADFAHSAYANAEQIPVPASPMGVPSYGFGGFIGDAIGNTVQGVGDVIGSLTGGGAQLNDQVSQGQPTNAQNQQYTSGGLHDLINQLVAQAQASNQTQPVSQQAAPIQAKASGGLSDAHYNLGGYSDGGRLLRGPGDGVSDSIPATIGHKQPARLADGEFVVPARIVSELGNGSTEAGARKLYAMMERVQKVRGKTTGKDKVATNTHADKHLPA